MISKEQVADLRPGDVVEVTREYWPAGSVVRGPLTASDWPDAGLYLLDGEVGVRDWQGNPYDPRGTLTVVSRAPRPLYVNHDRTEPVPGDVVRFQSDDHPNDAYTDVYLPRSEHDPQPWVSLTDDFGTRYSDEDARADHLDGWTTRLLVDGETGRCVP